MPSPNCDKCGKEYDEYGALLFSAPDENNRATKNHICNECYAKFKETFR